MKPRRRFGASNDSSADLHNPIVGPSAEEDNEPPFAPATGIGEETVVPTSGRRASHLMDMRSFTPQSEVPSLQPARRRSETPTMTSLPSIPSKENFAASPQPRAPMHSNSTPAQDDNDTVPAEIRCPVCLDPFRQPVTLQCNHSVCREHVADLAIAAHPHTRFHERFSLPCPKCRVESVFDNEQSIRVNVEMQAIVEMMQRLLKKQQQAATATPGRPASLPRLHSPDSARRPGSKSAKSEEGLSGAEDDTESKGGKRGRRGRRVTFDESAEQLHVAKPDDAVQKPPSAPAEPPPAPTAPESTPPPPAAISRTANKLNELEKQIIQQREAKKAERERVAQQKVDEYKRQRQVAIAKQREEAVLAMAEAEGVSEFVESRNGGVSEAFVRRMIEDQRVLRKKQLEEEEAREQKLREDIAKWMDNTPDKDDNADGPTKHRPVVSSSAAAVLHGRVSASPHHELSDTAKARAAEARIMPMYRAPTEEEYQQKKAAQRAKQKEEARAKEALYDHEVQQKLHEVEALIRREQEVELSRAEMAMLAEARAREMIDKFKKAPPKPTYVPKVNRIQKFP